MGLRDRIKQKIKSKAATARDAGTAAAAAQRTARRARSGAARVRDGLEQVDAGDAEAEDGARRQAEQAQRTAQMTAPVPGARLEPIDVPHPYADERDGRDRAREAMGADSLESFVTGGPARQRADDDRQPGLAEFATGGDRDDDTDDFESFVTGNTDDDDGRLL